MAGPAVFLSPRARQTYLALYFIRRTFTTTASRTDSKGQFHRSDFTSQGFTGYYEPGGPTVGPLGDASSTGAPRVTPRMLKQHLDQFVVGQERAKKVLSVAVYNHYQRVQELQRREEEMEELAAQQERRELNKRHPVEGAPPSFDSDFIQTHPADIDEFPGQQPTVNLYGAPHVSQTQQQPQQRYQEAPRYTNAPPPPPPSPQPIQDTSPLTLEKSNVLLLGPSGVGKTLMAKTLARVLEVPFSMSDCTPFTQAGYIGEDAEVCVQRLLAAANYDVARAERGIICLDEIDKIATAKVSHGKDVSGEGVQQALLKIIEGTTVQVQAKQERNSGSGSPRSHNAMGSFPSNNPMGGSGAGGGSRDSSAGSGGSTTNTTSAPPNKGEVYNINTDNILFICSGAFIGLHKTVMDRIARGSIGFGARVRGSPISGDSTDPTIKGADKEDEELFRKHVPFYVAVNARSASATEEDEIESIDLELDAEDVAIAAARSSSRNSPRFNAAPPPQREQASSQLTPTLNSLDLLTPTDLQTYGIIPELTGRLPITCALTPLSTTLLVRVLTEPRNSLLEQYRQLFALSGIELRFTVPALREVAKGAQGMGTGARGLRTVMERLLGEVMFEAPGGQVRGVLVTAGAARREEAPRLFGRGREEMTRFGGEMEAEEAAWERRRDAVRRRRRGETVEDEKGLGFGMPLGKVTSFEQYREKERVAGAG